MAGYKKSGEEMTVESKRRKSAKEVEANLEARIAGYQKVGEKQKKATEALAAAKARSEAGKAVWEKRQAEDAKIIEEQRKKIALKAVSGEINTEFKLLKKSDRAKLDRILEAYEEAENAGKFLEFMLENSDMPLTQERVEKDPALAQYLKSNFEEQELGLRYEDLVQALPTEQDYIDNVMGKVEEAAEKETEMQETFEKAQAAYVKAYREFDPKFTKGKSDDLLAVTRPPFFAFGAKAKELKNLYQAMDTARKNAASEADEEKIKKNLPVASSRSLDLKRRAALEESWYESEEGKKEMGFEPVPRADYIKPQEEKIKVKMPKTFAELSEGIKSSEKVVDYLGGVIEQQAEGKKKRIDEISRYFMRKNKMSAESVHKFLMGQEIKGLFNGSQRKMQREYKSLYNSPVYKEWLRLKGR